MKNKLLTLMLALFFMFALTACDNTENDEEDQTTSSNETNTEETTDGEDQTIDELFNQVQNNSPTSQRIQALKDIAMHYYWYGGDLKEAEEEVFKGITLHGDYDVVAESFRQAIAIEPHDMDLKFALASTQILQTDVEAALNTYEEITNYDEEHFNAWLMHGIYSNLEGDQASFEADFDQLEEIDQEKANEYRERMDLVNDMKESTLETEIPADLAEENHAFVVLGYALSEEGEMEDTLVSRLEVAKEAAEAYPNSKIIVSGGVPKQGITEADVMSDWLIENGIEEERVIKEDLATDTVENALFSMDIVQEEGLEDITVISSATHMRRALVIFNEINNLLQAQGDNTERTINNMVYMDFENEEEAQEATKEEELVIYRDLIRASGIWQFPGMQR